MQIFVQQPKTRKELEKLTAQVFHDMEFETEIGKKIRTARGTVEIDVFAVGTDSKPPADD